MIPLKISISELILCGDFGAVLDLILKFNI